MRVDGKFKRAGYFWLPDNPNDRIPGELLIRDGGEIELEIVGEFKSRAGGFNLPDEYTRLVGSVEGDSNITLDDCFFIQQNISLGGIAKSRLRVGTVFAGVRYNSTQLALFDSISFSTDCLDEWLSVKGVEISNAASGICTIVYTPPDDIRLLLDCGLTMTIEFFSSVPFNGEQMEAVISQTARIALMSEVELPLSDFISFIKKINEFLCFATDTTLSIKNVSARSRHVIYDRTEPKSYLPIKIYYQSLPYSPIEPKINRRQMLFTYSSIKEDAASIINNWLESYETIAPAMNLYFSTKAGGHSYLESRFLALAQGLETYHRRVSDEELMPSTEFDELVENLLNNCPESRRSWLQGRLIHGNSLSFTQRMVKILRPFGNRFGNSSAKSSLARKISLTRNYLTHYNEELSADAATGEELYYLCLKMEAIFELHFLTRIGFSDTQINRLLDGIGPLKGKLG
jgi:hypothetical protein